MEIVLVHLLPTEPAIQILPVVLGPDPWTALVILGPVLS